MRRFAVALAIAAAALTVPSHVRAAEHEEKAVTVQGEVLDLACYVAHGEKGPGHADCAKMCLKDGQPMGLLAKDGKVYLLFADHSDGSAYDKTKDLAGKNVEITGPAAKKGSIEGITVQSVKAL